MSPSPSHAPSAAVRTVPAPPHVAALKQPRLIWAVGAVRGEAAVLARLHDALAQRFRPGDRLVYLGNLIGGAGDTLATLDELLYFRRALLAQRGMLVDDIVYLRGPAEEMLHKLQQLHFAQGPATVLQWMLDHGLGETIQAYGESAHSAHSAIREGTMGLARWTGRLRANILARPGHRELLSSLRRAAATAGGPDRAGLWRERLLFVSAGLDPAQALEAQGDAFWWHAQGFAQMTGPYGDFRSVVRGVDPARTGLYRTPWSLSLDAKSGQGGALACAGLRPDGTVAELLEFPTK